jgi:inosine-uridine nucleoside N-ribohydrolase
VPRRGQTEVDGQQLYEKLGVSDRAAAGGRICGASPRARCARAGRVGRARLGVVTAAAIDGLTCRRMRPRLRVVSDNDYAGDPDGLFQLVHLLRSPSVDVRGVIGSHLAPGDPFDASDRTADHALREIRRVLELLGREVEAVAGANRGLADERAPAPSAGAELIVREALRTDTDLPLFVTLGGGLTELASAYLMEPAIAGRLTAVWIGGPEHPGLGAPAFPGSGPEYNVKTSGRCRATSTASAW